jgi:hypothetical protein
LAVNKGAVGATDVEQAVAIGSAYQLSVAARYLSVMQADTVGGIPAGPQSIAGQLELLAFVGTLDDDQARHNALRQFAQADRRGTPLSGYRSDGRRALSRKSRQHKWAGGADLSGNAGRAKLIWHDCEGNCTDANSAYAG